MEFTAKQIAELIQGRVEGDEKATVNTFAKIEEGVPGAISFLSNPKYTHFIYDTQSSTVLINDDVALEHPVKPTLTLQNGSSFEGSISGEITNAKGGVVSTQTGSVNVILDSSSTWTLTADTYVTSFTGDISNVDTNGYTLYVNGEALN